jgi:hypothetical protein
VSSKKLQGKHLLGREITIEFAESAAGNKKDIQKITITIPILKDSDQACVFLVGVDWAAKVVDANLAYLALHAAKNAIARNNVSRNHW